MRVKWINETLRLRINYTLSKNSMDVIYWLDYAIGVCAILTDNHLLGETVVSRSPALIRFFECDCYAVKSLQVVRSAHLSCTFESHVYCECTLNKSHDSSANMCCVIFAYSIWFYCVQKSKLRTEGEWAFFHH